jgi:aspartyl-tRNA(Asn)/glutamyl-tRNA(Gln) amidotransferase subunit A
MSTTSPATLSLSEASQRIHSGALSPVDLVEECLYRIGRFSLKLNTFMTTLGQSARREARYAAEALRRGEDWGPLHGIPVGIKDLIDVEGIITTAGSPFLNDNVAGADAAVVRRLRAAGAIVIGKTTLHEWALGATSINPHYGPVRSPWNTALSPGGSSGGSAAAVAAGMCLAALGTDTGGSVRFPAALCGLTGLRPAVGQISLEGIIPLSWTLDTVGPMAHTARDVALMLDAMEIGRSARYADLLSEPVRGLRLGLPNDDFIWRDTALDVVAAVRGAVEKLGALEMQVVEIGLPDLPRALEAARVISRGDSAAYHRERLQSAPERFGADVRDKLELGMTLSAADYAQALQTGQAWRAALGRLFEERIDVLLTPTTPITAIEIEAGEPAPYPLSFTYPMSLSYMPSLSVPCGFTRDGLPVGMQLVAPQAETLLRIGHAYQQATDWHTRRPALV